MFHGRKGLRVTCRWILLAATALLLSGVGLMVVPGAGATESNSCGAGKDAAVHSDENKGGSDNNSCGDTDGKGSENDGDSDDSTGGTGCPSNSSVVHSDETTVAGESSDCDGKGDGNDNDGDDVGGTTGPTGPTGPTGTTGTTGAAGTTTTTTTTTSGVTTTAPSGVQKIKGSSTSKKLACTSRRLFVIHIRYPHGQYLVAANVTVNGKRVSTMRGSRISSTIKLVGLPKGTVKVHIRAVTNTGKVLHGVRTYHTCIAGRHGSVPKL